MNSLATSETKNLPQQTPPDLIVNGVNVTKMHDTVRAIQSDPGIARFEFRAKNRWRDGSQNNFSIQHYYGAGAEQRHRPTPFWFQADEPPVLLGKDMGPNPVEYLLGALSACMTTTLAYHAAAHGAKIDSIRSEYAGDVDLHGFLGLDPTIRPGYREIRAKFYVKSDLEEQKILDILSRSPVLDSLRQPVNIRVELVKE